jgi:coenzyme F420-0:L-glutamate ligase / coenzyme F420-1:gamma-L-glutamate ligase
VTQAGEIGCNARLEAIALPGLPIIVPGDDLGAMIAASLAKAELRLRDGDVIVVASKLVSRSEGRFVDLAAIEPSLRARRLAGVTGHDPRHVEVVLRETAAVSRAARGVLIVRHRLGFVVANAGVDFSNAQPPRVTDPGGAAASASTASRGAGPWALLLPADPDASAARLRAQLGVAGVVISDSFGRPFRIGSVGVAVGADGVPALWDQRGRRDLFGRRLEHTETALVDQIAAVADLVAGQADEGRGAVLVRGLRFAPAASRAAALVRPPEGDLFA